MISNLVLFTVHILVLFCIQCNSKIVLSVCARFGRAFKVSPQFGTVFSQALPVVTEAEMPPDSPIAPAKGTGLRAPAQEYAESASLPVMAERQRRWYEPNSLVGSLSMVVMEFEPGVQKESLPQPQCTSPIAGECIAEQFQTEGQICGISDRRKTWRFKWQSLVQAALGSPGC